MAANIFKNPNITVKDMVRFNYWFFVARVGGIFLMGLLLTTFWLLQSNTFDPRPLIFGLLPFYTAVSFGWLILVKKKIFHYSFIYLQLFSDIVLITIGIHLSGGMNSDFTFLYALILLSASVVSFSLVVGVGVLAIFSYGTLIYLEYSGIIPFVPTNFVALDIRTLTFMDIFVFSVFVVVISFMTYFFMSRIQIKDKEILNLKDEFLFRTIHDLRAPANSIRFILEKYDKPEFVRAHPEMKADFSFLRNLNLRIMNLIQNCLTLAKEDDPEDVMQAKKINLPLVIKGVISELLPSIEQKKIVIKYYPENDLSLVWGDLERLKEVFSNLIDNAVKYSNSKGAIIISHQSDGHVIKTRIRDTGMGIPREYLEKLFTPYFRAHTELNIAGSGLGLYIVKKLLTGMHGSISVSSVLNKGTTFTVTLPIIKI